MVLAALVACTRVSGEVDGAEVHAPTGFFIEEDEAYGSDGLIIGYLSGSGAGCEEMDELLDALDDAEDEDARAEAWAAALPEEFWEVLVFIRVRDTDDEAVGDLDILGADESLGEDGQASVSVREYEDWPEPEDFAFSDSLSFTWPPVLGNSFFDVWAGDGAEPAEIQRHSPGEHISGRVDGLKVVDTGGDAEGELDLRFSLERCPSVEGWFFP